MENINSVELVGNISSIFHRDQFTSITIAVSKPSFNEKRLRNFPHVIWYGEEANEIAEQFKQYDRVKVSAYVDTTHAIKLENSDRYVKEQVILGKSIEIAKSDCEEAFGIKPSITNYAPDVNVVSLKGAVVKKSSGREDHRYAKVVMRIIKNNIFTFPEVYFFGKAAEYVMNSLKPGDTLCVMGTVQTYRKLGDDGKFRYFEDIVCNEIAVQPAETA